MAEFIAALGKPPLVWFWFPFLLFYFAIQFLARGREIDFSDHGDVDDGINSFWEAFDESSDDVWD